MIELNIIINNCVGQNKNCMVICTTPYMIDGGVFESENLKFHQRSHQNACNRMFNHVMKKNYSKRNMIYTKAGMFHVLGLGKNVIDIHAAGKFKG